MTIRLEWAKRFGPIGVVRFSDRSYIVSLGRWVEIGFHRGRPNFIDFGWRRRFK